MVELTHDEEFAVLTIRRPAALNALSFELIGRIGECIRESGRSSARALIVTGEGTSPPPTVIASDIRAPPASVVVLAARASRSTPVTLEVDEAEDPQPVAASAIAAQASSDDSRATR